MPPSRVCWPSSKAAPPGWPTWSRPSHTFRTISRFRNCGAQRLGEEPAAVREPVLRRLLEANPDDGWLHRELGFLLVNQRRIAEAWQEAEISLRLDPHEGPTYHLRASLLQLRGPVRRRPRRAPPCAGILDRQRLCLARAAEPLQLAGRAARRAGLHSRRTQAPSELRRRLGRLSPGCAWDAGRGDLAAGAARGGGASGPISGMPGRPSPCNC